MSDAEQAALLKAVCDAPDDDAPRLAYADWCDKRGDPRGEFIRLQIEAARPNISPESKRRWDVGRQLDHLLTAYEETWLAPLRHYPIFPDHFSPGSAPEFHRGFVSKIRISANDFVRLRHELFDLAPIQHLVIRGERSDNKAVFQFPRLRQILALSMANCNMNDEEAEFLADCPYLENLWWLSLASNKIGIRGIEAIIDSKYMRNLSFVNLDGNPVNPVDFVDEWANWTNHHPVQEELERKFGVVNWFHPSSNIRSMFDRPLPPKPGVMTK
jgi:uncharacterized protein (TIGR02996 family)